MNMRFVEDKAERSGGVTSEHRGAPTAVSGQAAVSMIPWGSFRLAYHSSPESFTQAKGPIDVALRSYPEVSELAEKLLLYSDDLSISAIGPERISTSSLHNCTSIAVAGETEDVCLGFLTHQVTENIHPYDVFREDFEHPIISCMRELRTITIGGSQEVFVAGGVRSKAYDKFRAAFGKLLWNELGWTARFLNPTAVGAGKFFAIDPVARVIHYQEDPHRDSADLF